MEIEKSEIIGYKVGNELVCAECLSPEESAAVTADDVFVKDEADPKTSYFCDRCKKRLF